VRDQKVSQVRFFFKRAGNAFYAIGELIEGINDILHRGSDGMVVDLQLFDEYKSSIYRSIKWLSSINIDTQRISEI